MADIDVVKKSSNSWLWILIALVVLALVLWFVMGRSSVPQTGFQLYPSGSPLVAAATAFRA